MAVNLLEAPFTELRWIPGEGRDGYPAGFAGILILLDISSKYIYAGLCFIKCGLNRMLRPGWRYRATQT